MHVTLLLPRAKVEPDAGEHSTDCTATLSEAVAVEYWTVAEEVPDDCGVDMSGGHKMRGGILSLMITLKEHEEDSKALLLAVHWTVVEDAAWNCDPDVGVQLRLLMPHPSVAVGAGLYVTAAYVLPVSGFTTVSLGQLMVGGVLVETAT